jgi:hypothetical protein
VHLNHSVLPRAERGGAPAAFAARRETFKANDVNLFQHWLSKVAYFHFCYFYSTALKTSIKTTKTPGLMLRMLRRHAMTSLPSVCGRFVARDSKFFRIAKRI